jgi:tetratricopeptide (TPR) repeat protein
MQRLRNDFLEKTLEYDKRFVAQRASDPSVKEELAATLFRMGRIEGLLKAPDQALPYLQQALEIQRRLVDESRRDAKRIEALAATENAIGREYHSSKKFDDALAAYQKGRELREQLTELDPKNSEYWRLRANSVMNIALLEKDEGRLDAAAQQLQAAQAMRQEHLAGGGLPKLNRDLAMGFYSQGVLDSLRRQNDAAAEHFREAISQFEKLNQADPNDLEIQLDLAINERLLADLRRTDSEEAAPLYKDACNRLDELVERNPDVPNFRYERARAYMNFGQMPPQEAETLASRLTTAKSDLQKLTQEFSAVPAYRFDLAIAQRALAGAEARLGQADAARKDMDESIDLLEQLVKEFPDDQQYALELAASRRAKEVIGGEAL